MNYETLILPQMGVALFLTTSALVLTLVIVGMTILFASLAARDNAAAKKLETETLQNADAFRLLKMVAGAGKATVAADNDRRRPHLPLQLMAASLLRAHPKKERAITVVRQQLKSFRRSDLEGVINELDATLAHFRSRSR